MKVKVRDMWDNTRDGITRRMRKEVLGCLQAMVGNKKFVVRFEYGQKRDMSASSLLYLCDKEEVGQEVDDTISDLPKI